MKENSTVLLEARGITKTFGKMEALSNVHVGVEKGKILALIGPNGSGKTTLINIVSGLLFPDEGEILFEGKNISSLPPHRRSHLGINRTFQIPHPFGGLTVMENVEIAVLFGQGKRDPTGRDMESAVEGILKLTGLSSFAEKKAETLNTGQKKMLDLAKALATNPRVLLIDELAAGLGASEMDSVVKLLREIAKNIDAVVVVEHVMSFIRRVTDDVVVLDAGRKIFEGSFEDAVHDERVMEVYLGASRTVGN
ncbi:MAG: ABC transporter ATP-binding protein [Candidatus Thermoplasmatota archaeon]|jgi:branched-chain amino acid transport system ATP-binding protein|nr:ABC transporter ATP-binding protein [Candidatus Thermoplasmatota archaeon]